MPRIIAKLPVIIPDLISWNNSCMEVGYAKKIDGLNWLSSASILEVGASTLTAFLLLRVLAYNFYSAQSCHNAELKPF